MVRHLILMLVCIGLPLSASAERPLTAEVLRQLVGDADRHHREKSMRIKGGDLSQLLPPENETIAKENLPKPVVTAPAPDTKPVNNQPVVTKYGQKAQPSRAGSSVATAPPAEKVAPGDDSPIEAKTDLHRYVPPPRPVAATEDVYTDAVKVDGKKYGIRIGTRVDVEMLRDVSSGEPGVVVFRVARSVSGRYQALAAGTEIFADKSYNSATQRLELMAVRGVTLDGEEFEITGQIYDAQKVSGLNGIVKKKELVQGSIQSGFLAASRSALGAVSDASPFAAGTAQAANVVLSDGEARVDDQLQEQFIIYVSRQSAKLFLTQAL